MTAHPYSSYNAYVQAVGNANNPLSQAEYNQVRNEMRLPPALGQVPMEYSTFQSTYQNSPVSRLTTPIYNGNGTINIPTQQSIQDWLIQNPIPSGNNEREVGQWINNFIRTNANQLNTVAESGNTNTSIATMLNNLANNPDRNSIWNRLPVLQSYIGIAGLNTATRQNPVLQQLLSNSHSSQYAINTSSVPLLNR